jgi:hypothetical protein
MGSGPAFDSMEWIWKVRLLHAESAQDFTTDAIIAPPFGHNLTTLGT